MELQDIKGIGKTRISALNQAEIFTVQDLINYFPKKYYDFSNPSAFEEDNLNKVILAKIIEDPKVVRFKGLNYTQAKMVDSFGNPFNAIWYNQPYLKSTLKLNVDYFLYGKNSPKKSKTFVVALSKESSKVEEKILPVYKKIGTFGSASLHSSINYALENNQENSMISAEIEQKFNLLSLKNAFFRLHNPKSMDELYDAKVRVDVEKLVPLALRNLRQKMYGKEDRKAKYKNIDELFQKFKEIIPYSLTSDQISCIGDIIADLSCDKIMNRLLQGEVGSGKTIIAFFAVYIAVKNGYQSSIIAPTEILARQHYENFKNIFKGSDIRVALLTSNLSAQEKREIIRQIKLGLYDVVIGTHAVISDKVNFNKLSLAVIDEQHRFGVVQRAMLSSKGDGVDVLVMSATPIPRTMALAIYGDLSLSIIKRCPFEKNIQTNIVPYSKQFEMWNYIKDSINSGCKAFVVCSKIDDDEDELTVNNFYKKLSNFFGENCVALIHGKLSKDAINKTMEKFAAGQIKVLVSTTVVEVGIDVKDANIMVIVSPERFGLATLHQLRGRVGRDGSKSYCFCMVNNISLSAHERLKFFASHNNGFDVAEFDYKNRGAGDIYGKNQHGFSTDFSVNFANYDIAMEIVKSGLISIEQEKSILEYAEKQYSNICEDIVLN